jgi:hypothetical protein
VKTPQQRAAWAADAAINFALAASIRSSAPELCLGWVNPVLIVLCDGAAFALATNVQNVGNGFLQQIIDPADPDYMDIVIAAPPPPLAVPDFPGLSPTESAAWSDLVPALADISVLSDAIITSFNRAQGAFDAGAPEYWDFLQLYSFNKYDNSSQSDMVQIESDAAILGLDTSSPAAVPEPGTFTLLSGVLVWLCAVRRRNRSL